MKRLGLHKIFMACMLMFALSISSCSRQGYHQASFGGMKGRVQEAVIYHIMPPDWRTGGDTLMYVSASAYDIDGNEICSALMDSLGRVQSEAESMFENGICLRSTQKAGAHKVIAQIELVQARKGLLVYDKKTSAGTVTMQVRERCCMGRYTSKVSENGKLVTVSTIRTDKNNLPVEITTVSADGRETVETNKFSTAGNIIEKHVRTVDTGMDDVTITEYTRFDEHGNWTEARTFNKIHMAREILRREIKYWP